MLTIKKKDIHNLIGYVAMRLSTVLAKNVEINCYVCSLTKDGVRAQYGNYVIELSANDTEAKVDPVFNVLFIVANDFYAMYPLDVSTVNKEDLDKCVERAYDGESLCDNVYRYMWKGYSAVYHEAAEVLVLATSGFRLIRHTHANYTCAIGQYFDNGDHKCEYNWIVSNVRQFCECDDQTQELRQLIREELDKRCIYTSYTASSFLLDLILLTDYKSKDRLLAAIKETST